MTIKSPEEKCDHWSRDDQWGKWKPLVMNEDRKKRLIKAADDFLSASKKSIKSGNLILAQGQAFRASQFLHDVSKTEDRILPVSDDACPPTKE